MATNFVLQSSQGTGNFETDFFGGIIPTDGLTASESRDAVQQSNSDTIAANKAKRESQGTNDGSTLRVNNENKTSKTNISKGGANIIKDNQTVSNSVPSTTYSPYTVAPDYYRNGLFVSTTKQIAGESIEVQEWSPMPELIAANSDDWKGTLASIKLIDPKKVKKTDNGGKGTAGLVPEFSKFFLESVQESHQEKYQIVETFNDFYTFFYGERPPVYTFSGTLLNLKNYNWMNEFLYYYSNFWRGTKAAELGARVFLTYNYQQIQGYVLNISTNVNALTDKAAPFSIQVLVTKRLIFSGNNADGHIRDNLLPKTDTGLINQNASTFKKALVSGYLKGNRPASSLTGITDSNKDRGINTQQGSIQSTLIDQFPGGNKVAKSWAELSDSEFIQSGGSVSEITRGGKQAGFFKKGLSSLFK